MKLSWYENLLLWLLIRSPRIDRIVVEQFHPRPGPTPEDDDGPDEALDDPELDFIPFLEQMYRGPSADRRAQQ